MPLLRCGTGFFENWENDTHEAEMASFMRAAGNTLQTEGNPLPLLLPVRSLAWTKNP